MRKRDSSYRVWLDKGSALATGVGAALVLSSEQPPGTNEYNTTVAFGAEWRATSPSMESAIPRDIGGYATKTPALKVVSEEEKWTESEQKRFHELGVEEAVGQLNQEEAAELEELSALRRAYQNPRSGDEVLWEFEQRQLTSELLATLRRYVEFYEGADSAWSAAS